MTGSDPRLSAGEIASHARSRGSIVVLLDAPAEALVLLGKPFLGEQHLPLELGPRSAELWLGESVYPAGWIDGRRLPPDLAPSASFLAITVGGGGELERGFRAMIGGDAPDPWALEGEMRALIEVVRRLLAVGKAVVLPRAEGLAYGREEWLRLTETWADPRARPFRALVDAAIGKDQESMRTRGLELFGLPEVVTPLGAPGPDALSGAIAPAGGFSPPITGPSPWLKERALEAVLFAAQRMVHQNRVLDDGEALVVPVGARIGAELLEGDPGDANHYRAQVEGPTLRLIPSAPVEDGAVAWQNQRAPIGLNTYSTLFERALAESTGALELATVVPERVWPDHPPYTVHVLALPSAIGGFLTVTNGVGRVPQPGAPPGDPEARIEIVAWSLQHGPAIAQVVAQIADCVHLAGAKQKSWPVIGGMNPPAGAIAPLNAFTPGHRVILRTRRDLRAFLMRPAKPVTMGAGPSVVLYEAIPLEDAEVDGLGPSGLAALLEALAGDPAVARARAELWSRVLSAGSPPGE